MRAVRAGQFGAVPYYTIGPSSPPPAASGIRLWQSGAFYQVRHYILGRGQPAQQVSGGSPQGLADYWLIRQKQEQESLLEILPIISRMLQNIL